LRHLHVVRLFEVQLMPPAPINALEANLGAELLAAWEAYEWRHATTILRNDFPDEWADLLGVFRTFRLRKSDIDRGGGNKAAISRRIDGYLHQRGGLRRRSL
jgi:hypothetical protein